MDLPGQQQGVPGLFAGRGGLPDRAQQILGGLGVAAGKTDPGQLEPALARRPRGAILGEEFVVYPHGVGRVASAQVVAGRLQEGAGGEPALAVEALHLLEGFGGLLEAVQLLQAVGALAPGLGHREVPGVSLDKAVVRRHGLCAARAAGIGAGQQQPGIGHVGVAGVVADEVGEELGGGGVVGHLAVEVAGQQPLVIGVGPCGDGPQEGEADEGGMGTAWTVPRRGSIHAGGWRQGRHGGRSFG